MTINQRIVKLEQYVEFLLSKINDLSKNVEEKEKSPYTISGGIRSKGSMTPIDAKTGLGQLLGNHVIWNDSEVAAALNEEPLDPEIGYNKHSHSKFSGGALIKDVLEIVEYDWGAISNKHSQQFWVNQPEIKTELNSNKQTVQKIGKLDLVFNPDTQTWGVAALEIDVKKCNFVERDENGNIALDNYGNPKRSPLYNSDTNKTSIIWDSAAGCWRLLAVYASGE